jgi:hypothetical protein
MPEILALLTAKTASWIPSGGGGEITPQMVAAACAGLPHYDWLYVMCKFGVDTNYIGELRVVALDHTKEFADRYGWKVSKRDPPNLLHRLSDMALDSSLENKLCFACNGTKVNRELRKCGICGGTGEAYDPSQASQARLAGVSIESWNRRWKRLFSTLVAEYDVMESSASSHVRRNLRRRDEA